jgi:hypothetical protein
VRVEEISSNVRNYGIATNRLDKKPSSFRLQGQLMEKIIRLNAVELVPKKVANYISKVTSVRGTLREIVTNNNKTFLTTPQGAITKPKARRLPPPSALLRLVQLNSQAEGTTVMIWAWTEKIAEVAHTQRNAIITLIARTHWIVPTLAAIALVHRTRNNYPVEKVYKADCISSITFRLLSAGFCLHPLAETQVAPTKSPKSLFWRKLAAKLSLLRAGKKTKLPAKIAATTTLLNNTKHQLKQQRNLTLSKHLRTWEISVCIC